MDQLQNFVGYIESSFVTGSETRLSSLIAQIGCEEDKPVTAEFGIDLEIAFRNLMERLLDNGKNENLLYSPAAKFISFSVDFAEAFFSRCPSFARVPFQLIDDFLEDKNISQAKEIWPLLESLAEKLTSKTLFPKGKFIMLKTCNFLLKKLSKSCDTEFCGRVLLFLAAIYPISEKSAANIAGRINTTNITHFDTRDVFSSHVGSEISEVNVKEDGEASDELNITYELYENFWKLQTFFASEFKALDQSNPTWNDFITNAKTVIDILKQSAFTESSVTASSSGLAGPSQSEKENNSVNSYQGTKYLTSSQLFALQLRDPQLRQQVAVQLLIFTHYLRVKSLPSIASAEQRVGYLKDITFLHNQAKNILESIPGSHSSDLVAVIHRVLEREENWIRWKSTGSNPFEKTDKISVVGMKRKADEILSAASAQESKKEMRRMLPPKAYSFDCSDSNIKRVASQWEHSETHFADKIQEYIDADDPDCGIDDEYHPKHNHLYCWRTRRMLAERDFSTFEVMLDGDVGKGLRKLKNLPEPVPKAKEEECGNESEVAEDTEPVVQANRDTSRATVERVQSMDVDNTVEEGEEVEENEAVAEVLVDAPMAMNEDQDNSVAEAEVQPEIADTADVVENTTESAEGIDIPVEMDVAESDIPSKE